MMSLGLTTRAGSNYRIPPNSRPFSVNTSPILHANSFKGLCAAALVASVVYVVWNKKEEPAEVAPSIPKVDFCQISKIPSLKTANEAKEIAFLLAKSSDQSCRHLVYNLMNTHAYEPEDVFLFMMELSKETVSEGASDSAKENLVKWLYLVKSRYPGIYPEFIKALHNEGIAPLIFSEEIYQKSHENSRMMHELKSDYLALNLK